MEIDVVPDSSLGPDGDAGSLELRREARRKFALALASFSSRLQQVRVRLEPSPRPITGGYQCSVEMGLETGERLKLQAQGDAITAAFDTAARRAGSLLERRICWPNQQLR